MLLHIWGQILLTSINNNCRKLKCLSWPLSMKQTFDWHMSMFLTSCANQVLHSLASRSFQNPGVCLQAFPSFPRSHSFIFWLLFHARGKTKNPFPLSFFSLKSNGNACYSGYLKTDTEKWGEAEFVQDQLWGPSVLFILETKGHCTELTFAKTSVAWLQALWGALVAGREKEGELASTSLEFEFHL